MFCTSSYQLFNIWMLEITKMELIITFSYCNNIDASLECISNNFVEAKKAFWNQKPGLYSRSYESAKPITHLGVRRIQLPEFPDLSTCKLSLGSSFCATLMMPERMLVSSVQPGSHTNASVQPSSPKDWSKLQWGSTPVTSQLSTQTPTPKTPLAVEATRMAQKTIPKYKVKSIRVAQINIHHIKLAAPDIWQPVTTNLAALLSLVEIHIFALYAHHHQIQFQMPPTCVQIRRHQHPIETVTVGAVHG